MQRFHYDKNIFFKKEPDATLALQKTKTYGLALIGVMTAVLCVLGPISIPIPFSPVPITLTNFAVFLAVFVLGWKWGTVSYLVYLLIGIVGVPVFSGFTGGPAKLIGPTGGYLIGFIFLTLVSGFFIERFESKHGLIAAGMALGILIDNLFGTIWLAYLMKLSFGQALLIGVVPYLIGDAAKLVLALLLGSALRRRLKAFRILA